MLSSGDTGGAQSLLGNCPRMSSMRAVAWYGWENSLGLAVRLLARVINHIRQVSSSLPNEATWCKGFIYWCLSGQVVYPVLFDGLSVKVI